MICLTIILYIIGQAIVFQKFIQIENEITVANMRRISKSIETEKYSLTNFTRDWADWDDTYKFINDHNKVYKNANLNTQTQVNNNMDVILYLNNQKQIVFQNAADLKTGENIEFPSGFLSLARRITDFKDIKEYRSGLFMIENKPMLIAAYPVLKSDLEGPANGSMVQGRYLTDELVKKLSASIDLPFSVYNINDPAVEDVKNKLLLQPKSDPVVTLPVSGKEIKGSLLLYDLFGAPALIANSIEPRNIYIQGETSMWYLAIATVVSGLVFGIVIMLIMNYQVLSRIAILSKKVRTIDNANSSERLPITAKDEIGMLAVSINSMLDTIEESQKRLEWFIDIVSHDLRSPLTAVVGYTELIRQQVNENKLEGTIDHLEQLRLVSNKMVELLESLLTLSRAKKQKYTLEVVNTSEILKRLKENMSFALKEKGTELVIQDNLPTLKAYKIPMQEIFQNLLNNAIKFSLDKEKPKVSVGFTEDHTKYEFFVKDNGIGILPGNKDKLFTLFYAEGKYSHAGVGLTIVKEFVEMHRGKVRVESKSNEGTTFYFTIPKEKSG